MLRFFRQIRQKLMEQNKVQKYLIYALGEIFLVVIGILIALQINNFNESKKDRAFELKMLSEINQELQSEISDKRSAMELFSQAEYSLNELLKMRVERSYSRDSVDIHLNNLKDTGLFFPYSDGAYEALKSGGLDKISNDELRKKLVRLYSYTFDLMAIFVNELARPSMISKFEKFDEIFPPELQPGPEGVIIETYDYSNFEKVVQSSEFFELLNTANDFIPSINNRLESLLRRMTEVQLLLQAEVDA